ncbi:MAG: hypothetical protein ABH851_08120 [Methanobacteriota archaeon]
MKVLQRPTGKENPITETDKIDAARQGRVLEGIFTGETIEDIAKQLNVEKRVIREDINVIKEAAGEGPLKTQLEEILAGKNSLRMVEPKEL